MSMTINMIHVCRLHKFRLGNIDDVSCVGPAQGLTYTRSRWALFEGSYMHWPCTGLPG